MSSSVTLATVEVVGNAIKQDRSQNRLLQGRMEVCVCVCVCFPFSSLLLSPFSQVFSVFPFLPSMWVGGMKDCEWCGGEGCDVCQTCDFCNGEGCEMCGADGDAELQGDDPLILLQNRAYEAEEELRDRPRRALQLFREALEAGEQLRERQGGQLDDEQASIVFRVRKHILLLTLQGHNDTASPGGAGAGVEEEDRMQDDDTEEESTAAAMVTDEAESDAAAAAESEGGLPADHLRSLGEFLDGLSSVTRNEGQQAVEDIFGVARALPTPAQGAIYRKIRDRLRHQKDQARLLFYVNNQLCRASVHACIIHPINQSFHPKQEFHQSSDHHFRSS